MDNLDKDKLPKVKAKLEVKNEVSSEIAELYLYGTIRESYWWEEDDTDVISSKRVRKALKDLGGKDINVHIASNGGEVFESIAIRNLLKQHDGKIFMYVDSIAASGASVIVTAGDIVYMYDNTMQMIHNAWTIALGDSEELRKVADDLDKINISVRTSYMNRFIGTEGELEKLLSEETFLTAEECLAFGLCDEIIDIDEEEEEEESAENNIKKNLFNKYKKNIESKVVDNKTTLFNAFKNKTGGNE